MKSNQCVNHLIQRLCYEGFIQQLSGREGVFNDKTKQWLQLSINHSAGKQTSKE